ncbi:MAG: flavodoxin [Clostridiales bacterium]|jgi:menaquinone-dependent protoporphyrinogen IX oxidase|nr:flavodoxin [Clostridiales bacterium]
MKGIVLYQSKYSATKKYAHWLAEDTGFAVMEVKQAGIEDVRGYDVLILGGGIYASGIAGLSFLKKHVDALEDKTLLVFCVGASPYDEEAFRTIVAHNLKDELSGIPCFYCRGAWNLEKMNLIDRTMCKLLRKMIAKKDPATYEVWEKALMAAGDQSCDWTDRKYIAPMIEYLNR